MNDLAHYKVPLIIEGVLLSILGVVGILFPGIYTFATELFVGSLLVAYGLVRGFRAFQTMHTDVFWIGVLSSLIAIGTGVLMLLYPLQGVLSLTILLMVFFLLEGIAKMIFFMQMRRSQGSGWVFLSGLLSFFMAGIIFSGWPETALWVIGLLVGIDFLFAGVALSTMGFQMPKKT